MFLKKLEIYGFKSFADKIHIEFDKGITAIVGPNGSGKSNVADAVRWVLGEQSAKSLRGAKMEDIIFAGTQVRKPLGFAEVSLTLDNTDGALPLDYSEVTVTRRVFRSGESEYYINRSACRLKDIVELFMDTGVGKEGYSIIGQGRIEEILSTRSEDRRQIFEEAAGIVKYKARREEAERKLEKTRDNLLRVEDILSELAQQLGPLEVQSQTAREYLKLKEQLRFYDINQFILQYRKHNEKMDELKEQVQLLEEDIHRHKDVMNQRESREVQTRKLLGEIEAHIESIREERYETLHKIERVRGEIAVVQEKIQQFSRDSQRLVEERSHEEHLISSKTEESGEIRVNLQEKLQSLEETRRLSQELQQKLQELQQNLAFNQEDMEKKKGDTIEILNRIADLKNKVTRYRTMESSLLDRQKQIKQLIESKTQSQNEILTEEKQLQEQLKALKANLDSVDAQKQALLDDQRSKKSQITDWDRRLQQRSHELEGKKSRIHLLKDMKEGYEGFNKSIRQILKACQQNIKLQNKVCGVVAELIKVPKKYETAIETALGASMQYVVTEREEDAKYIIDFLRQNQYGRATFLPISSVRGRYLNPQEKAVLQMEGCVGAADALIEFDDRYREIFQNLLGRVVIAETLDQAIQMAKRFSYAFRIVTLDGDVMNPGGSMTGGSSGNRGISILGRNREIVELGQQIAALEKDLAREIHKKEEMAEDYGQGKRLLEDLERKSHELDLKRVSEEEKLARLALQYQSVHQEINNLSQERSGLEEDLKDIIRSMQVEKNAIQELESRNADAQEMAESAEAFLRDMAQKKEEITSEITENRIKITGLEREVLALREQDQRLQKEIAQHHEDIEKKNHQIKLNSENTQNQEMEISAKNELVCGAGQRIEELDKRIQDQEKGKKDQEKELEKLEDEIKGLGETIGEITDRKYKFQVQLSRLEAEQDNLQNNIWEEYEISYAHALTFLDETITLSRAVQEVQTLKGKIGKLGEVNVNAIDEYKRIKERHDFLMAQKNDLMSARQDLKDIIKDITTTMEERFKEEFAVINEYFAEVFSQLFGGGKAQLILEDKEDVLDCGIEIVAQPPGKKLQSLTLLSGGEKALTAIAILFAILKRKPTPFCVLDEIEAALDEHNVYHFGDYLKEFAKQTQFVIITHRKGTMESSDVLYGIAMEEKGVSKLVSVRLEDKAS